MSSEEREIEVSAELLRRYDRPGPRYTSYPTAVEFSTEYTESDYRDKLAEANAAATEPLSLYVHLPFCRERCDYCGCNVVITKRADVVQHYLESMEREIEMLAGALPDRRRVMQLHWGGGTPTHLSTQQMERLHGRISERFDLDPEAEVAIEIDPRVTAPDQLELLRRLGFNRVSMGVQDFDAEVQSAIGRHQTEEQTRSTFKRCRDLGFQSVNLDLVYGLPRQSPDEFQQSMQAVVELRPDRIALYSYAHVPWIMAHQKRIDAAELPEAENKLRLFCLARAALIGAGYVTIGMDHFALPDDELVEAMGDRRLDRNFMGYTVRGGSDMVGLGVSAVGAVRSSFAQNVKKLSRYHEAVEAGRFPIERGYQLDLDDRIRRDVIRNLMCNFYVSVQETESRHGIDFAQYFAAELAELAAEDGPQQHGFIRIAPTHLEVKQAGRLFVRNLAMIFDRHLRTKDPGMRIFSRTV